MENKSLRDLVDDLNEAQNNLEQARKEESAARSVSTDRLNTVNRLQKEIDKKIEQMKSNASNGSDWKSR